MNYKILIQYVIVVNNLINKLSIIKFLIKICNKLEDFDNRLIKLETSIQTCREKQRNDIT